MRDATHLRVFRPFKLLAVIMVAISMVLTIASVAGPDWMEVSFYHGEIKSWGLWWSCFEVTRSFQMCVETDWLFACAALVLISLISTLIASGSGVLGLCTHKQLFYYAAAIITIFAVVSLLISLIIYPVKFTQEVRKDSSFKSETQKFQLDWTYGIAWGAICFMLGGIILFLIPLESREATQAREGTPPPYYTRAWTGCG